MTVVKVASNKNILLDFNNEPIAEIAKQIEKQKEYVQDLLDDEDRTELLIAHRLPLEKFAWKSNILKTTKLLDQIEQVLGEIPKHLEYKHLNVLAQLFNYITYVITLHGHIKNEDIRPKTLLREYPVLNGHGSWKEG